MNITLTKGKKSFNSIILVICGDHVTAAKIMNTSDPRRQKSLGRSVRNYDDIKWKAVCQQVVKDGNYAKVSGTFEISNFIIIAMLISDGVNHSKLLFLFLQFSQNEHLKAELMETAGTILVEASPWDTLWGIGLYANDPRALRRKTWKGKNWLGFLLTELREEFLAAEICDELFTDFE